MNFLNVSTSAIYMMHAMHCKMNELEPPNSWLSCTLHATSKTSCLRLSNVEIWKKWAGLMSLTLPWKRGYSELAQVKENIFVIN